MLSESSKIKGAALLMVLLGAPLWAQPAPPASPAPTAPKPPAEMAVPPAPEASAVLTDRERDEDVHILESTVEETNRRVAGLSEEAWNWKPAEDRWSIAEVVEHLVLVEEIFATLDEALEAPANPNWHAETHGKESRIYSFMPDRSRKAQAPEFAVPQGGRDRAEMLEALAASRKAWVARIQEPGTSFKAHTAPHPAFGALNTHQWFLFIGLHHLRHNLQIVEVMAEPDFPH